MCIYILLSVCLKFVYLFIYTHMIACFICYSCLQHPDHSRPKLMDALFDSVCAVNDTCPAVVHMSRDIRQSCMMHMPHRIRTEYVSIFPMRNRVISGIYFFFFSTLHPTLASISGDIVQCFDCFPGYSSWYWEQGKKNPSQGQYLGMTPGS